MYISALKVAFASFIFYDWSFGGKFEVMYHPWNSSQLFSEGEKFFEIGFDSQEIEICLNSLFFFKFYI